MHLQQVIILLAVSLSQILAQVPGLGKCPEHPVVQKFNVSQYMGKWYEIERYFSVFETDGKCITAEYTLNEDETIGVAHSQIQEGSEIVRSLVGSAELMSFDDSAKLQVSFPFIPFEFEAPYWVLATDYGNYSIVWSCKNTMLGNHQNVWFLSRSRDPAEDVRLKVLGHLKRLGVRSDPLQPTNQEDCGES